MPQLGLPPPQKKNPQILDTIRIRIEVTFFFAWHFYTKLLHFDRIFDGTLVQIFYTLDLMTWMLDMLHIFKGPNLDN